MIFRHIQGYWYIFHHINKRATRGERGGLHYHFWKSKKVSWFWKERSWLCPSLDFIFSIQNVVLRVFRRKTSKMIPSRTSFSGSFWRNVYQSVLFLVVDPHSGIIVFAERSILNVWQCSEYICLDNCSVAFTVTLC